jgi:hypothetical protein
MPKNNDNKRKCEPVMEDLYAGALTLVPEELSVSAEAAKKLVDHWTLQLSPPRWGGSLLFLRHVKDF